MDQTPIERTGRAAALSIEQRNLLTLEAIHYFFLDGRPIDADILRNNITPSRVSAFYRYYADLWPRTLNAAAALRTLATPDQLSGYFSGWVRPETILRAFTRISLYADRIFIPLPFHLPWMLQDHADPVQHPDPIRQDTHRWVLALLLLEPWIRRGLALLIPEPREFDPRILAAFLAAGETRRANGKVVIDDADFAYIEEVFKDEFFQQFVSLPDNVIIKELKEHGLTDDGVPEMLSYLASLRSNPYFIPDLVTRGEVLQTLSIPTIEDTVLACGLTGAFPFTNFAGQWRELLDYSHSVESEANVWTPLTHAFSSLRFDFIDGYDPAFALELREDGRLHAFRSFLRKTWKIVDGTNSVDQAGRHARDLSDELQSEYLVAQGEWRLIHQRFGSSMRKNLAAAVFGVVGSMFTTGPLGVALSLACSLFSAKGDAQLLDAELANFRAKIPLSVFIDLESTPRQSTF